MIVRHLEFRGINRDHLGLYFEELGGRLVTESFPYIYEGTTWRGEILSEEELAFTSVFKVNSVKVLFAAETEIELESLIKNYRYKTTRVGG
jgi:hypothetical protein